MQLNTSQDPFTRNGTYVPANWTIAKANLTVADFVVSNNLGIYNGDPQAATVAFNEGIIGAGEITVTYKVGEQEVESPINTGEYDIYVAVAEGEKYNAFAIAKVGTMTISKATLTVADFTFTAPEDLTWDGNAKSATVTFDDQNGKLSGCGTITVKYNGSTEAPIAVGEYVVSIDVAEGTNYVAVEGLIKDAWNFTIEEDPVMASKVAAIAAINAATEGVANADIIAFANNAIDAINAATSVEEIENIKNQALAAIALAKAAYQAGYQRAFDELPTDSQDAAGHTVTITKGNKKLKLVNPDNVEFGKQ